MPVRRRPVASDRRFRAAHRPDYGPSERWQHSGRTLELTEQAGVLAARVTEEHVVDSLVLQHIITPVQREAALKFKLDFHRAALAAHVTGSYNRVMIDRTGYRVERERNDLEEAAYQRWRNATRAVGMMLNGTLIAVICQDIAPAPHHLPLLQKGLEKLVKWYGLPEKPAVG